MPELSAAFRDSYVQVNGCGRTTSPRAAASWSCSCTGSGVLALLAEQLEHFAPTISRSRPNARLQPLGLPGGSARIPRKALTRTSASSRGL